MTRIRVLTVDDAVVVRRMLADALSLEPDIEIVGSAATGRIALQKIPLCRPDVVTLDVEMPDMDGISTVREIRKLWPTLPVIMFSTLTARGASATLDALSAGASDYVTKPANVGGVTAGLARIREDLAPRIRSLAAATSGTSSRHALGGPAVASRTPPASPSLVQTVNPVDAITVGTSTGGPNALAALLPAFPADLGVPVFVVQHMPPLFTRLLADRLDQQCGLKVVEAQHGVVARPGHVYIAPGDYHMVVRRGALDAIVELTQGPPENSCRPAVDVLFRSVANSYGRATLAVVMTGMGQDGLAGARHVKDAGGIVVIQDEATSVVWGMPGFVARAGLADAVRPLPTLADEIITRVRSGRARTAFVGGRARS